MASNNTGEGHILNHTATANIVAGQLVVLYAGRVGVALEDIASGAVGPVALTGTWTVNKTAASHAGAAFYIPRSQSVGTATPTIATGTAGTTLLNGYLIEATTTAQTTCKIRLF